MHAEGLRRATDRDLIVVDPWFDDPQTKKWLGGPGWAQRALDLEGSDRRALIFERDGRPVGFVDVEVYPQGSASFAYVTDPSVRRTGAAHEALRQLIDADDMSRVTSWFAGVEPDNTASRNLLEGIGFTTNGAVDGEGFLRYELAAVVGHARGLLGRTFHGHGVTARITEVEAYGGIEDPASHAFTRTPRSEIMYNEPWRLYVYRSYGMHFCANVVTGPQEKAAAVLIRAGEIVQGHDLARERRGATVADHKLASGPGNFARALGLTLVDLGTDLTLASGVRLGRRVREGPSIAAGPRVGISKAADVPWRFWVAGDSTVSAYRRSPRA